jgi:hypothetical protein
MTRIRVIPLLDEPILPAGGWDASDARHENINGPCLIRVPSWAPNRLANYYLYFADHKGSSIKLALADELAGPWKVHDMGVLQLSQTPFLHEPPAIPATVDRETLGRPRGHGVPSLLDDCTIPHIASPDVIVDDATRSFRLYYHGLDDFGIQVTRVAVSGDGLHFEARSEILAPPYLRVFAHEGVWYGLAMPGGLVRSATGLGDFVRGPTLFEKNMRHAGVWRRGDELWVFWTRVGDAPERILLSKVDLREDWIEWLDTRPVEVHRPTRPWEGADQPIAPSLRSSVDHPVHQLRDPYVFVEGDEAYLLYAVAGESGVGIGRLEISESRPGATD